MTFGALSLIVGCMGLIYLGVSGDSPRVLLIAVASFGLLVGLGQLVPVVHVYVSLAEMRRLVRLWLRRDGATKREARIISKGIVCRAAGHVRRQPDLLQPDRLFKQATADAESGASSDATEYLNTLRAEGATDQDIRSWYGKAPLLREVLIHYGNHQRLVTALQAVERGVPLTESASVVHARHATFGPVDPSAGEEAPTPIPWELYDRAQVAITHLADRFGDDLPDVATKAGGLNMLIREVLRHQTPPSTEV